MKIEKQTVTSLAKCYALAEIEINGETRYLVASEKQHACIVLDRDGNVVEKVWDGPGGVMTMEAWPGEQTAFLATQRFYSPNDSADARLVLAWREANGWQVKTLCSLPFVHRFGILERDGRRFIVAATLKSAHAFKEDWTCPGRVWVGELPMDLETLKEAETLVLEPLMSGLLRNHGFFKLEQDGYGCALIGAENGVFRIMPPARAGQWQYEQILDTPASDIAVGDFDGDGEPELLVFSPFHGDQLLVFKAANDRFEPVYKCEQPLPFLHAIGVCWIQGREVAVVGHRGGERALFLLQYTDGAYRRLPVDSGAGAANVLCRTDGEQLWILAANREIDEVAIYRITAV